MRKRDRDRLAKQVEDMANGVYAHPLQQLFGAEWYFKNGAEGKGLSSCYAALSWLKKYAKDLDVLLKKERKRDAQKHRRKTRKARS